MSSERKVPDDRELEDFLAGKHPAGRAYREASEGETAPRELDGAILRMARDHAATATATGRRSRRPRWLQPLAVAATLALSLGMLLNIWRDPTLREQVARKDAAQEEALSEGPVGSSSSRPAPVEAAEPIQVPQQKSGPPPHERSEADRHRPLESRRAEPFPAVEAVPPSAASPRAASPDAAAAPSPPPPPAMQAAPASPAAAGGAAASRPDFDPRVLERDDAREAAAVAEQAEQERSQADDARAPSTGKIVVQESMADEAGAGAGSERAKKGPGGRDVLIERARAAMARGDIAEARRVATDLRRLYPDALLPEDLRDLAFPPP